MITKIRLKNWKSHLESELNFSTGTNALLGHMGSGKTSVLDCICFALFGIFPSLQSKKLKIDDLLMNKPSQKDKAEVEVEFQSDGNIYTVKRVVEKGKGTTYSEIRQNGNLLESPSTQRVTEFVEKILKVNYELFSKAIYSEQNALDYFLTIPKGQRMKKIDELLMIERFEKARANAVSLVNKLAERKIGKQSIIDQTDLGFLEKNIAEIKISLSKLLEEKNISFDEYERIGKEKNQLEEDVINLQKIKEQLELLRREERGITTVANEISSSLKSLELILQNQSKEVILRNLDSLKEKIATFEIQLKKRREDYEKIASEVSALRSKTEFLKSEKIGQLEKEISQKAELKEEFDYLRGIFGGDVERQLEFKRNLFSKLIEDFQSLKTRIQDIQETVEKLMKAESICPLCETKLLPERKKLIISHKEEHLTELKAKLDEINKKKDQTEKELRDIEEVTKKLSQILPEIQDLKLKKFEYENSKKQFLEFSEQTIKAQNQLATVKKEIEKFENDLKETGERRQAFEILLVHFKDFESKKARLEELANESRVIELKLKEIEEKISGKDLTLMESRLKQVILREKELETKITAFDEIIKERKFRLEEFEVKLKDILKQKEEVKRLDKLIKDLKIFGIALEQTQIELRREFVEAVNYTMNKLWQTLYPYQDFIGIRLFVEEGDYLLQLQTRYSNWVNVEGIVSGGERSIAALALRIAFALVLAPQLKLLFLDEPTANLDSKAITELATTLRERIHEFIDQTFLITHQSELEDAVTGNAYRLEREKGRDGVTKIISL